MSRREQAVRQILFQFFEEMYFSRSKKGDDRVTARAVKTLLATLEGRGQTAQAGGRR